MFGWDSSSRAQQSVRGNCNVQVVGSGNVVNIICQPRNIPSRSQNQSTNSSPQVKLQAAVSNLQPGNRFFTLYLINKSSSYTIDINPRSLDLSDNFGNTYEIDGMAMSGTGFSKKVPPNSQIKLNYALRNPISKRANSVTFTLEHIWGLLRGSSRKSPLPAIQWTTAFVSTPEP